MKAQASRVSLRYVDRERRCLSLELKCTDAEQLRLLEAFAQKAATEGFGINLSLITYGDDYSDAEKARAARRK